MRILVVDDEEMKRVSLAADLTAAGHEVVTGADGAEALAELRRDRFDVVVADLRMPGIDGMELLRRSRVEPSVTAEFVMITAYGSIPVAVEAMRLGAFDFVTKPFHNDRLLPILRRIEARRGDAALAAVAPDIPDDIDGALVGGSPLMQRVKELVAISAGTDSNVLLCGETGTGKDLTASLIHKQSARRRAPFVKVSCAVFPTELVASELYGHEKGSFTGAERARQGRFELAEGGTLYLDDVDDIPFDEQIKLLRVIEERVFERVGGATPLNANVRVIAATKRDLRERSRAGAFREDLFYRLNVMRIDLPPLRERIEDLPQLVRHLLARLGGGRPVGITPAALARLAAQRWPGNVRELANTLERAALIGRGGVITEELVPEPAEDAEDAFAADGPGAEGLNADLARFERERLVRALSATRGNKSAAARLLGLKPSTLRDHLARHRL